MKINKRNIDGVPYTCNTVTNQWDKNVNLGTGASGHLATTPGASPPQQPTWTPPCDRTPPHLQPDPFPKYTKRGTFLAGFIGTIGQQYSHMGFHGQPSPSQLAAMMLLYPLLQLLSPHVETRFVVKWKRLPLNIIVLNDIYGKVPFGIIGPIFYPISVLRIFWFLLLFKASHFILPTKCPS